jgi:hypothetical protein
MAILATARVRPRGAGRAAWAAGTFLFVLATSVLFFASFEGILPFYARGTPRWLW